MVITMIMTVMVKVMMLMTMTITMTMMMTGGRLSGLYPNEPRTCICLLNLQHAAHAAFAPTASDLAARRPLARTKTPSTIHVQDDVHMQKYKEQMEANEPLEVRPPLKNAQDGARAMVHTSKMTRGIHDGPEKSTGI